MMARVPASERTRKRIAETLSGDFDKSALLRGAMRLIVEEAFPGSIPVLVGIGATATLAQLAMTRAYKEGHVLIVGSLSYSTVAFTSLLGILIWGEWLDPGEWLGLGLIVASGVMATSGLHRPATAARAAVAWKDERHA